MGEGQVEELVKDNPKPSHKFVEVERLDSTIQYGMPRSFFLLQQVFSTAARKSAADYGALG